MPGCPHCPQAAAVTVWTQGHSHASTNEHSDMTFCKLRCSQNPEIVPGLGVVTCPCLTKGTCSAKSKEQLLSPCSGRGRNGADRGLVCKELTRPKEEQRTLSQQTSPGVGKPGFFTQVPGTLDKSRLTSGAQPCLRAERGPQTHCSLGLEAVSFHTHRFPCRSLREPSAGLRTVGGSRTRVTAFGAVRTWPWWLRGHQGGLAPVAYWDPSSNW